MLNYYKNKIRYGIVLLLLSTYCLMANATTQQGKVWTGAFFLGNLLNIPNVQYILHLESRFNLNPNQVEFAFSRMGVGYQYTPTLSFWLGYQADSHNYFTNSNSVNRIWQLMIWQFYQNHSFMLTNQSRLEERQQVGQGQWNDRLRERFIVQWPGALFNKITPVVFDEVFFNLTTPSWTNDRLIDQNRAFAGIEIPTSKHTFLQIGYLNQYVIQSPQNTMNHVLYLSFYVNT